MTEQQTDIKKYSDLINEIKEMELKLSGYLGALEGQSQMNASHIVNMKQSEEHGYEDLTHITNSTSDISKLALEISELLFAIKKDMEYTSSQTRDGSDKLSKMSEQIQSGTKRLNSLKGMLEDMTALAKNVRGNIESLEDISARIDILSINASIEAARAGTHGVGFKVVATEIKKLSVASKVFSQQITTELNNMDAHNQEVQDAMYNYGSEQELLTENLLGGVKHWNECDNLINGALTNISNISELTINQNENIKSMKSRAEDLLLQNQQNLRASNLVEKSLEREASILSNLTNSNNELRKKLDSNVIKSTISDFDENSKVLKIGHDLAYPPWVYLHQGRSAGLSIDYCNEIMERSSIKMEFEAGQWISLLDKLESGELDLIANVGWPTKFLKDGPYCVTEPYASFDVCYFQSNEWNKVDDNYSVTCQKGSFVNGFIPKNANFQNGENNDILNFVKLVWQKVDRVMTERRVGEYISKNFFEGQIISEDFNHGSIDVVFVCHERNKELRDKMNEVIRSLGPIK